MVATMAGGTEQAASTAGCVTPNKLKIEFDESQVRCLRDLLEDEIVRRLIIKNRNLQIPEIIKECTLLIARYNRLIDVIDAVLYAPYRINVKVDSKTTPVSDTIPFGEGTCTFHRVCDEAEIERLKKKALDEYRFNIVYQTPGYDSKKETVVVPEEKEADDPKTQTGDGPQPPPKKPPVAAEAPDLDDEDDGCKTCPLVEHCYPELFKDWDISVGEVFAFGPFLFH
jgi:hypothetical protein